MWAAGIGLALLGWRAAGAGADAATHWVPCPVLTYANVTWNSTAARRRDIEISLGALAGKRLHARAVHAPPVTAEVPEGYKSECTFARVPLDHSGGVAGEIGIFVKRLTPEGDDSPANAVWLLSGGPGDASADDVEPLHKLLATRLYPKGSWEVFILDHRGTARSSRLGCRWSGAETPGSPGGVGILPEEWAGCLESLSLDFPLNGSHYFSTGGAARDLHMLMERFRRPGQSVSVYGISYGTYWAGRYARLFPDHARAIVLDGVVSASGSYEPLQRLSFERWDVKMDQVGRLVLDEKCGSDSFCSGKLGPVPTERVADLFQTLEQGDHCASSLRALGGIPGLKHTLGGLLYGWSGRSAIPALLYRLMRCSAADVAALEHFVAAKSKVASMSSCCGAKEADRQAPPLFSEPLLWNIALSELWDPSATTSDLHRWAEQGWFSMETFADWPSLRQQWPVYEADTVLNTSLQTSSAVLLMNGDIDCQTPLWSAQREFSTAKSSAGVALLEWPDAVHFTALNTPVEGGGDTCGLTTVAVFLSEPSNTQAWTSPPCRSRLLRLDFRGDPETNKILWGTTDAYEGSPAYELQPVVV